MMFRAMEYILWIQNVDEGSASDGFTAKNLLKMYE